MRLIQLFAAVCPTLVALANEVPEADLLAIRDDVTVLASDSFEGRATGAPGFDLAASYVAERMRAIGLAPAGDARGWLQPMAIRHSASVLEAAQVTIAGPAEQIELAPAVDFVALPSFLDSSVAVEAPLVFVGFGVSAPELGHDDLADVDIEGKVAVVIDGVPHTLPPELRDYHAKEKGRRLAERGIVGVVYLVPPEEDSWDRAARMARNGGYRLLDGDGRPHDVRPELEAAISVSPAAAGRLFMGARKTIEAIWADARAGRSAPFDLPAVISIRSRSVHRAFSTSNVVGVLGGSDPDLRHEHVVLLAHLDHIGKGAEVDGDTVYNGAVDNATGVAVMLEAARMLAGAQPRPRRSILFLATAAEEAGLLGARNFATKPTVQRESLVAAVNIDMPVALYPPAGYTPVGGEYSTLGDVARDALGAEGLLSLPTRYPERGLFTIADQYAFVREGIPALYIHDAPLSADPAIDAQQIFDEFLQQHYHERSDEIDLPIRWDALAKLARVNARVCLGVANENRRPRWLAGSYFGAP